MKEIKLKYSIVETKVVAYIEGCSKMLKEEQILDYFRLLDLREFINHYLHRMISFKLKT